MTANSSLNLTSLDFDTYKTNLITFLNGQSRFKGYNFAGDDLNVLMDILAYNTFLNGFYMNMAVSESFLDTCQLRDSAVSHAKALNYVPTSMSSPYANINLSILTTGISNIFEIPKGTLFSGKNSNGSFIYTTNQDILLQSTTSTFTANNVLIYEGTYINETFIIDPTLESQQFVLSNPNIDISSIQVTVSENNGANIAQFVQANTLFGLTSTSNVYFMQATANTKYQILFGDNVFGRYPLNSAVVLATYRITKGSDGNGITTFSIDTDLGNFNGGTAIVGVSTATDSSNQIIPSLNGANAESLSSIKFRAPKSYQTQLSAVSTADFEEMIIQQFPDIKSVHVYGGETVTGSIQFGVTFIIPATYSGYQLTDFRKQQILDFLQDKITVGLRTTIVDPDFLYIVPSLDVIVNFSATSSSPATIKALVANTMLNFNANNLDDFDITYYNSIFENQINNTDASIISNETSILVEKRRTIPLNIATAISLSYNNEILPGTINSKPFVLSDGLTYTITDFNPNSNTFVSVANNNQLIITNPSSLLYISQQNANTIGNFTKIGSVDYSTGTLAIKNLTVIDYLNSPGIVIQAAPADSDVSSINNDILLIDVPNATIDIEPLSKLFP